jgi:ketosteroid isomerase-like protein
MAQDNVDLIQSAWDAFGRGNLEEAVSIADPSGEVVVAESLPWGGTYQGPDGFSEMLGSLLSNFEQFKAVPEKVLGADDNHVVVIAKTSGRTKAGNTWEGRAVWVYQLRDGKVVRAEAFTDTARVLEALG